MTTEHYLWAIFALLWIALVLVIVTARRGPWQPPRVIRQHNKGAGILWIPAELTGYTPDDEDAFVSDLTSRLNALVDFTRSDVPVPEVRLLHPGVDPLWGKNRP